MLLPFTMTDSGLAHRQATGAMNQIIGTLPVSSGAWAEAWADPCQHRGSAGGGFASCYLPAPLLVPLTIVAAARLVRIMT